MPLKVTVSDFLKTKLQQKLLAYEAEDAARLAEIDRLLADPSKITQEDRRRLSGDYLTKEEIEARDKDIAERVAYMRLNDDRNFNIDEKFKSHQDSFHTEDQEKTGEYVRNAQLEKDTAFWFFVLLSVGKVGAAEFLSNCINRNMGFTAKDDLRDDFADFVVGMGAILGDPACLAIIARTGTISDALGPDLEPKAKKCSGYITDNAREFAEFEAEGKTIYLKDVLGYAKTFDSLIEHETGMSYIDNMPSSEFKYFFSLLEIQTAGDIPLAGIDGYTPAPEGCCVIM
jgi:hypothetical protein